MKSYPSISTQVDLSLPYHIFDKLDGSNVRAEWSPKRGFHKFGSRTQLLTPSQQALWPVVERVEALSERLGRALVPLKAERAVCFFEWVGPQSFAGTHLDDPADMQLVLLDIDVFKKGRLGATALLELAQRAAVPTPALLHQGRIDVAFLESVRQGALAGMGLEGIIGKGPHSPAAGGPVMFKHKSQAWFDKLKARCGEDVALFERLR